MRFFRQIASWAQAFPTRAVACMSGFVVLFGSAYAFSLGSRLRYHDEREFLQLARDLVRTGAYSLDGVKPTAYRPPAWPFLLSLFDRTGVGVTELRLVSVVLLALTVPVVYLLARRIAGREVGLLAALLVAVNPLMLYTATTLYPEPLALLLVTTGLWAVVEAASADGARLAGWAVLAGAAFSVLALTSPAHAVVAGPATIWLIWRRRWPVGIVAVAVIAGVAAIGPIAWGLRNEARLGGFVPLSTNGGQNLLLGNSPDTTASSGVSVDLSRYEAVIRRRHLDEVQADTYRREQAIDWIRADPRRAATLYVQKLLNFFSFRNELATGGQRSPVIDLVSALAYYPLLSVFLIRLLLWRRFPFHPGELMLATSLFLYALVCAVFFTRLRFRVPVDQLMIIVAASGIVAWWKGRSAPLPPVTVEPPRVSAELV